MTVQSCASIVRPLFSGAPFTGDNDLNGSDPQHLISHRRVDLIPDSPGVIAAIAQGSLGDDLGMRPAIALFR